VPTVSQPLVKLILLSPDQSEVNLLQNYLEEKSPNRFSLFSARSALEIQQIDERTQIDAALIDLRFDRETCVEAIRLISGLPSQIPILLLCREANQISQYDEVLDLVDDFILLGRLSENEFVTRISHAMRKRKSERELVQEKALLQSLLDTIPDAIFFKDRQSRFIKINKTMETIYGKHHDTILGKTDFDLFAEEHARDAYNDEQEIIRTGEKIVSKIEKETFEDEDVKWVNTTKVPLKDQQGEIIGTMGISRNITDLKQVEDSLAKERNLLKTIIENALAGIFVKDREGRYLMVNRRHAKYLSGDPDSDVIGKTLFDFLKKDEATRITAGDKQIMDTSVGEENMIDHRRRADGSELFLLSSKVPLQDDLGTVIGLVGISLDITEQKTIERKLKSTIQTLEETKLQLIEAEKLKTIGRLSAGVAHEVKNPLNVVSLGAQYLESQIEGPEEILEIIRDIREAVKKANNVIFELLDYSSPHEMEMKPANINQLIEHVLGLLRHNLNTAKIQVYCDLDDKLDPVRLDSQKMEQALINLVLNAISVMKSGGTLTLRSSSWQMKTTGSNVAGAMTELFEIGDTIVSVEIIDSGAGLSEDDENKAFDPFYTTNPTGQGTGLGLSVTRSIVDLHHGMITLENRTDGPGAVAQILLPAATETKK